MQAHLFFLPASLVAGTNRNPLVVCMQAHLFFLPAFLVAGTNRNPLVVVYHEVLVAGLIEPAGGCMQAHTIHHMIFDSYGCSLELIETFFLKKGLYAGSSYSLHASCSDYNDLFP